MMTMYIYLKKGMPLAHASILERISVSMIGGGS